MAEGLGRAEEGEAALLVLAEDVHRHARDPRDLGHDLLPVGRLADRRGGDGPDRLGSQLLGKAHLGGDHLRDLGDLLGIDAPLCCEALPIRV